MELVLNGVLSAGDRSYILNYNNGHSICEVVDKLYEDGFTSSIRIIGHMDATTYIINKYEAFIISDGKDTIRVKADDLRHILSVMNTLKEQA